MSRQLLFAAILCAAAAPAAQAGNVVLGCPIMIDDFEHGVLPPANGPFEFTHLGLPAASCAGGSRHVVIDAVPTHSAGMVPLGGSDLGYQIQTQEPGTGGDVFHPDVLLDYEMALPLDLTAGGLNDRLTIDVVSVSWFSVFVYVTSGASSVGHSLQLQQGSNELLLSSVAPYVDLTQVDRIRFYFNEYSGTDEAELTMSRIRVGGSGHNLYIDLPIWVAVGPEFPLFSPFMTALFQNEAGPVSTAGLVLTFEDAQVLPATTPPTPFSTSVRGDDSGLFRSGGLSAGFAFEQAQPGKSSHSDGHFDFLLTADAAGIHTPSSLRIQAANSSIGAKAFYLVFDVDLLDVTGAAAGHNSMLLQARIPQGVLYRFANVRYEEQAPLSLSFSFDLLDDGSGGKAPGQQLFEFALSGDNYAPYLSTGAPLATLPQLELRAQPSVFGERTELRLSRPLASPSAVRVFDLAGRLVRSIPLGAGQSAVLWDARDGAGTRVASGLYVAQIAAGAVLSTQKLIVVR